MYWFVVTLPCGIVHILVMIRLRVVFGGRRVGQVLPSYQNRQISALDETADAPQSSLSSLLSKYLSLFSRFRSLAVPSGVARGCSQGGSTFFLWNNAQSEKVCSSHREKGEPPGRLPNSQRNNEHSGKALYVLSCSFMFFHFLPFSFMFYQFLAVSFIFYHFRSFSFIFFHFLSVSLIFLHFPSFSFIFCHFLSLLFSFFFSFCFLLVLLFFSGAQNPFFASIASRFPMKALMLKIIFLGRLGGERGEDGRALLFSSIFSCFFHFRFLFQFLFLFSFSKPLFSFCFPLKKMFLPFSFCFSFFFSRVLKICGGASVCTFKTSPCMPAPRAHVLKHVRVVPVHTGTF